MLKSDVLKHFKTGVAVASFLEISEAAFSKWPDVVPEGSAYKLLVLTNNRLRVNPALYPKSKRTKRPH